MSSTTPTRPEWKLIPAGPEDAAALIACGSKAFAEDKIENALFPKDRAHLTPPDEVRAWRMRRYIARFQPGKTHFFKVVHPEDPSRIIGQVGWYSPHYFADKNFGDHVAKAKEQDPPPAALDPEASKAFFKDLDDHRKEIWGDDTNYWYLASLAVDPEFQKQGIAKALVRWGTDRADQEGIPAYLESTPAGTAAYPKLGFEYMKTTELLGGADQHVHYIHHPKKQE